MNYLAMNRFAVRRGSEADFERIWLGRQTHLPQQPGFVEFSLIRGAVGDTSTPYATHTVWRTHDDFLAWTRSEAFRAAHAEAGATAALVEGAPRFEGYTTVQSIDAAGVIVAGSRELDRGRAELRARLAARLARNPDGVLETLAGEHGVSLREATLMLGPERVRWAAADRFDEVLAEVATWGEVLLLVHTPNLVLEVKGELPPGEHSRGYFNLHGSGPIAGHLKADRCAAIAFVRRPFFGSDAASIQFFDTDGAGMFKIFVRRAADRQLDREQLGRFETLALRLGSPA
jgi:putative heme utilization carrier protein HutX